MARQEPPLLTAFYTVVGAIIFALIAAILWLVANYLLLFVLVGGAGVGAWYYFNSNWALEKCKIACNIDPLRGLFASNSDPL